MYRLGILLLYDHTKIQTHKKKRPLSLKVPQYKYPPARGAPSRVDPAEIITHRGAGDGCIPGSVLSRSLISGEAPIAAPMLADPLQGVPSFPPCRSGRRHHGPRQKLLRAWAPDWLSALSVERKSRPPAPQPGGVTAPRGGHRDNGGQKVLKSHRLSIDFIAAGLGGCGSATATSFFKPSEPQGDSGSGPGAATSRSAGTERGAS